MDPLVCVLNSKPEVKLMADGRMHVKIIIAVSVKYHGASTASGSQTITKSTEGGL
jgi:hypothetical protein